MCYFVSAPREPKVSHRVSPRCPRMVMVTLPAVAVASATSDRLVPFLLGEQWADAAPIFFWLSLVALVQPISNPSSWLFITSGRTQALFKWGVISCVLNVAAFTVGIRWGPVGVAAAYAVGQYVKMPILFAYVGRGPAVSTKDLYAVIMPTVIAAAVTWTVTWSLSALPLVYTLALCIPIGYALTAAANACSSEGRDLMGRAVHLIMPARFSGSGKFRH